MDFTPSPHMLESMQSTRMSWKAACAEVIDNAFDANATKVDIRACGKTFEVRDNGIGTCDLLAMAGIGHHKSHSSTMIGMYGVGLKDAWLSRSRHIQIESCHEDAVHCLDLDIDSMRGWNGPDPVTRDKQPSECGTTIRFLRLRCNLPSKSLVDELSLLYTPGLSRDKQITVQVRNQKKVCEPVPLPALSSVVHEAFTVDGREVEVYIGLCDPKEKKHYRGFRSIYRDRIISMESFGAEGYSVNRLDGEIRLGKGWRFTKHKDALTTHGDALSAAVQSRILYLLEESDKLDNEVETKEIRWILQGMLDRAVSDATKKRPRRDQKQQPEAGTILPIGTGRRHTKARKTHDLSGAASPLNGGRRGFSFDFYQGGDEIGEAELRARRVSLNENHPSVMRAKASRNLDALHFAAVGLLAHKACTYDEDGRQTLAFEFGDFVGSWSRLLASIPQATEAICDAG